MTGYGKFNGRDHKPENGGAGFHAPGIFAAQIIAAKIVPTSSGNGAFFEITYKTAHGEAVNRHNLWNTNPRTVEIAQGELTALCHCINFYDIDFDVKPDVIVGAPVMIEVGQQMVLSDPNNKQSAKVMSPNMTEIKRLFSAAGVNPVRPNDPPVTEVLKELIAVAPLPATPAQEAHAASQPGAGAAAPPWNAGSPAAAPAGVVAAPPAAPAAPTAPAGVTVASGPAAPPPPPVAGAVAGAPPWGPK